MYESPRIEIHWRYLELCVCVCVRVCLKCILKLQSLQSLWLILWSDNADFWLRKTFPSQRENMSAKIVERFKQNYNWRYTQTKVSVRAHNWSSACIETVANRMKDLCFRIYFYWIVACWFADLLKAEVRGLLPHAVSHLLDHIQAVLLSSPLLCFPLLNVTVVYSYVREWHCHANSCFLLPRWSSSWNVVLTRLSTTVLLARTGRYALHFGGILRD